MNITFEGGAKASYLQYIDSGAGLSAFLFLVNISLINLTTLGHCCGTWDLHRCTQASLVAAPRLSCSAVLGTEFLYSRQNPCPLHWKADSYPLDHEGSPLSAFPFLGVSPFLCLNFHHVE